MKKIALISVVFALIYFSGINEKTLLSDDAFNIKDIVSFAFGVGVLASTIGMTALRIWEEIIIRKYFPQIEPFERTKIFRNQIINFTEFHGINPNFMREYTKALYLSRVTLIVSWSVIILSAAAFNNL